LLDRYNNELNLIHRKTTVVLKKLNLDGTKEYETALACFSIANMLDALLSGRDGDESIGSEQGGIPKWDDFVIKGADNSLVHIQAKRNNTNFCDKTPTRGTITQGPNKGELYGLSPLDESMKSLAEWTAVTDIKKISPKRKFILEVASGAVLIKKDITVNDFRNLCNDHLREITTNEGFETLITTNRKVAAIIEWLKSWCGFKDNSHVLIALKLLSVEQTGNVIDIVKRSVQTLTTKFNTPQEVYDKLKGYVNDNATFTTAITAKIALDKVKSYLLPNVASWTQYQKTGTSYRKNGTHDLTFGNIETPKIVVPQLWDSGKASVIKLDAPANISEKIAQAVVRLALHLQAGTMAHLTNYDAWKEATKNAIGGTLGTDVSDLENINSIQCSGVSISPDSALINSLTDQELEANALHDEMQKITWDNVCNKVFSEIASYSSTPLRSAVEARWSKWKLTLDANLAAQKDLCVSMLHPVAEGKDIEGHLRVGQKTAGLISKGIFILLVVSVCLDGSDDRWDEVGAALTVSTNALRCWSGAHGEARKPRMLIEKGRDKLLASDPSKILILSEVQASPFEVREVSLAHEASQEKTLAAAHEPRIIVTMCPKFSDLIHIGDIQKIKEYLELQYST
jgi:hypothetical protein